MSFLMHHGILNQKWGVRRFQNEDGSLTAAGRARYRKGNVYDMDDDELRSKVNAMSKRSKLVKSYEELSRLPRNESFAKVEKALDGIEQASKGLKTADSILRNTPGFEENAKKLELGKKADALKSIVGKGGKDKNGVDQKQGGLRTLTKESEKIYDIYNRPAHFDIDKLTDEDLKKAVDRLTLERDYKKYTAEYADRGKEKARETMQTIGSLLAMTTATLGVVEAIKKLKE